MAKIFPFAALQYSPRKVPLDTVVTQPYDKITPAMQRSYYAASPYNLVRIELGLPEPGDGEQHNVYTRAAGYLRQWRQEGVLEASPEPAYFRYAQRFAIPSDPSRTLVRVGLICAGQLEDYDRGIVFRHELTHTGPKADRLNLLRATRCHIGQLFMLYGDPERRVESLIAPDRPPDLSVTDEYKVVHEVWRITEPGIVAAVTGALADKKLIIADGHHRYETALAYRNERRAQGTATPASERAMMTLVNMDSDGLCVLPTHRLVHSLTSFDGRKFLGDAGKYFESEALGASDPAKMTSCLAAEAGKSAAIVAVTGEGAWLLRYRPKAGEELMSSLPELQRGLDVAILHRVLIEGVLCISEEKVRALTHVSYHRDAGEAVSRVRSGEGNVAFLINPVSVAQVRDIAFAGGVMPQKSTDFYPKMLSGLAMYALE